MFVLNSPLRHWSLAVRGGLVLVALAAFAGAAAGQVEAKPLGRCDGPCPPATPAPPPGPPSDGVSSSCVEFVAAFEGFRAHPYRDSVGVWTIGYGETQGIGPGTPPWTKAYALNRMRTRLNADFLPKVLAVTNRIGLRLGQSQVCALTSFTYNLGPGPLNGGRTMGDALRSKDRGLIAKAFLVYVKAGGRKLQGLVNRRSAERAVFLRD